MGLRADPLEEEEEEFLNSEEELAKEKEERHDTILPGSNRKRGFEVPPTSEEEDKNF